MLDFILNNWGTILILLALGGVVTAIAIKMIRDKRRGKPIACDCGCKDCTKSGGCRTS